MAAVLCKFTIIEDGAQRVEMIKDMDAKYGDKISTLRFYETRENSLDLDQKETRFILSWTESGYLTGFPVITISYYSLVV